MTEPDLKLLLQQQQTMILDVRALTASVRRMDEVSAVQMQALQKEMAATRREMAGVRSTINLMLDELRATNRKIDDTAARLSNLEIAR